MSYISWEMTHTSVGGEKQAGISGGSQSPSWYSLRQGAHCPVDNGFAPTETECRLAEVRSISMSSEWEPKCNFKDSGYIFRGKGWTCILRNVMVSRAVWWCFLCQKHFAVHHLHHPLDITKSDIAASDIRMFLLDCIGNSHSKALFTDGTADDDWSSFVSIF